MVIAIIGAGAMGCLYGAYLSKENDVIMLDSYEPQVNSINQNGVTLIEADGSEKVYKNVKAYKSGTCKDSVDLVIVFVKSTYTEQALEENKDLFGKDTFVMTLQNGAGNDRKIKKYVNQCNIIIGTSKHNAVNLGEGKIKHGGSGMTTIGSNYNADNVVEAVASCLGKAGIEVEVSDDIQRIIWSKLFVNLSINTFTALIQTPIGYMIQNESAWNFAKRLVYEAVEVAEADGTYFDRREALEMVRDVCTKAGTGYSSMYQDRKKKIKMEIDAINGAIVEQAKLYGVPTPYNSLIVDLIHAVEGAYDLYD
ncbi:2-dehydropantoate 2-reductase [Clostridium puniceum]|uniref:2-dehydropantoate 2-reductase n=1 Tax=Clostridium puniceum TaxID=29367 RepID=A0A1S8TFV5_9CLOT|nr:2-dehydropantoate 2-reductase [Clostridium puniceum]OOM76687.1 2-dehydropantoate 2-reductase [Clostridium puniceum]